MNVTATIKSSPANGVLTAAATLFVFLLLALLLLP